MATEGQWEDCPANAALSGFTPVQSQIEWRKLNLRDNVNLFFRHHRNFN
jgi:hypothetical protein